jgi:hypothetical protein
MRRASFFLAVVGLLIGTTSLSAQERPNFSGTWTLQQSGDAAAGGGGGARGGRGGGRGMGLGMGATIAQDAGTLTITRTTQNGEVKSVYKLDGSESRNTVTGRGGQTEQVSKARWDGNKVVITTTLSMGENTFDSTMALSLDNEQLVVETTSPGRGGGAATTNTQRYTKS